MPILTPEEYKKRASEIYDPSYAVKIANENTAFNNTMSQYGGQENMINNNFDRSAATIDRTTKLNQNQMNNNTLSRGMARSSAATTGIAGVGNTGIRETRELEVDRNQQLNNLETLKSNLRASLESTLKGLASEREGGINSMAMQLQQRDEDIQRQLDAAAEDKRRYEQEWAFKQQQAKLDESYRQAQLKKTSSGGGSGSISNPSNVPGGQKLTSKQVTAYKKQIDADFNAMLQATESDPAERTRWIQEYSQKILYATNNDESYLKQLQAIAGRGLSGYYGTNASLH